MTYKNKLVAVVKCNGKVLREQKDEQGEPFVTLPFGAEYTLAFKNLHTQRAVVKVSIDGEDVLAGRQLVVNAHDDTELHGFMSSAGIATAAFKFIQKTKEIADHRGDRLDDGIINVSFAFEIPMETIYTSWSHTFTPTSDGYTGGYIGCGGPICRSINVSNSVSNTVCGVDLGTPQAEEGITVHGSDIQQNFSTTYVGTLGEYETVVLRLRGIAGNGEAVKAAVTTKTKTTCPTCGHTFPSGTKFCSNCGTNLTR